MNASERAHLLAEEAQVRSMLAAISPSMAIGMASLKARLVEIQRRIEALGPPKAEPLKVRLTFRGEPVLGSQGIFAEFGAQAVSSYTQAVAKLAVPTDGMKGKRGPIPQKRDLMVTGTALGSFGFELAEVPEQAFDPDEVSPTAQAMNKMADILHGTTSSDDELASSIADVNPRALKSVRTFLGVLKKYKAVATLTYPDRYVRFQQVAEVERSLHRLDAANVHEETRAIAGRFQGCIPKTRTFQFQMDGEREPVIGKIFQELRGYEQINRHLGEPVVARMKITRIGEGRPTFVLMELPQWGGLTNIAAEPLGSAM